MADNRFEDIARGQQAAKLRIGGRPRQGRSEAYVILEEPEEPVQMHWREMLVPHFKKNCPHCAGADDVPKSLWYVGAIGKSNGEPVILELTAKCFRSARAAAGNYPPPGPRLADEAVALFTGLLVTIVRADFAASQRILRCEQRVLSVPPWPYRTREELARIWGIRISPRIYREQS